MDENPSFRVKSVVASCAFSFAGSLERLAEQHPLPYSSLGNGRIDVRLGAKRRYAAIYRNGRARVAGASSVDEARSLLADLRRAFELTADISDFRIENIVVASETTGPLQLETIAQSVPEMAEYEPEQFPGLLLRLGDGGRTALLFSSGKVILTGMRAFEDVELTLSELRANLGLDFRSPA